MPPEPDERASEVDPVTVPPRLIVPLLVVLCTVSVAAETIPLMVIPPLAVTVSAPSLVRIPLLFSCNTGPLPTPDLVIAIMPTESGVLAPSARTNCSVPEITAWLL